MKKILSTIIICTLFMSTSFAAGKLMNADFQTEAQLTSAGATKASLLNDSKVYVTAGGINDRLDNAITSGLIGGSCSSMLSNGCLENGTTGWTNVNGVFTTTSVAGEFTEGSKAAKIALTAQVLNFSQTVNTTSGIQKQGVIGAAYKIPSAITDFQICSLVDGAEQTCLPSTSLITDNLYHPIEIPITFGSTSAGIKFKTTASYTQNVFFDKAYLNQGIGYQNLLQDPEYRAQVSASCVVTNQDRTFLATPGTLSATSQCAMVFSPGIFTTAPNCTMTLNNPSNTVGASIVFLVVPTATGFTSYTTQDGVAVAAKGYTISCKRSGNDYLAASASVYSQASGNYDWTSYTPTITGVGTISSPSTNYCKHQRQGSDLLVDCSFVTGTVSASIISITLPNGLLLDSTKIIASNTTAVAGQEFGYVNQSAANYIYPILSATGTSTSLLYMGNNIATATHLIPTNGTALSSSVATTMRIRVPIAGWSNSNVIVGSFAGVPAVPGYQGNVDTFSVSYGTTNATTNCTASPCSYLDQIGTAVSSIARTGTGTYTLNTARTYSKLKCTASFAQQAQAGLTASQSSPMSCANCSSLNYGTGNTVALFDSFGLLDCKGSY